MDQRSSGCRRYPEIFIYKLLICFIAGVGAGLGTGFAGMSAAVISPMLITFLGLPAYEAVGSALASDILASANTLNRATGVGLAVLGTAILAVNYLG